MYFEFTSNVRDKTLLQRFIYFICAKRAEDGKILWKNNILRYYLMEKVLAIKAENFEHKRYQKGIIHLASQRTSFSTTCLRWFKSYTEEHGGDRANISREIVGEEHNERVFPSTPLIRSITRSIGPACSGLVTSECLSKNEGQTSLMGIGCRGCRSDRE